jgi:MEDS: MEthanogen/methylotroph, DcmR Sensory domain
MSVHAPWNDRLAEPLSREHFVQLYRDDRCLVEAVALFAGRGLGKGDAVIVVATPEHRAAIEGRLRRDRFEVDDLVQWRQLTLIDAAELLSQFMAGGLPDPGAFKRIVGDLIESIRAAGGYRRVRVYGEMVNLLWNGNLPAATRLEQLWNELIEVKGIALFCAYAIPSTLDADGGFPAELRALHSHIVPVRACG